MLQAAASPLRERLPRRVFRDAGFLQHREDGVLVEHRVGLPGAGEVQLRRALARQGPDPLGRAALPYLQDRRRGSPVRASTAGAAARVARMPGRPRRRSRLLVGGGEPAQRDGGAAPWAADLGPVGNLLRHALSLPLRRRPSACCDHRRRASFAEPSATPPPDADVVMALQFWPRGGSAQVVRYLAPEIVRAGWPLSLVTGSLGGPGDDGYAPEFFAPLPVTAVDYSAAMDSWRARRRSVRGGRPAASLVRGPRGRAGPGLRRRGRRRLRAAGGRLVAGAGRRAAWSRLASRICITSRRSARRCSGCVPNCPSSSPCTARK